MQLNAYLIFNGNCEEAFQLYTKCLGGKIIDKHTHGNSPMAQQLPSEWHGKIMHIHMEVDGSHLMGSDAPPQHFEELKGMSVSLNVSDVAEAERIYKTLSEGGTVRMPLQPTFWAERFAMFSDRFGVPWMINCAKQS